MFQPKAVKVDKKFVPIAQPNFSKGYISTLSNSRMPIDGLAQMVNMTLEQDSVPRPRPPFIPYGSDFDGVCIGIGTFNKIVDGAPEYWEISMQNVPYNTEQTVATTGSPTGGYFTLTYSGQTTGHIPYNASAAQVVTALAALSNIGIGNVSATGGALPTAISVQFIGTLANTDVATMTTTYTGLSGGTTPTSTVTLTQTGGPIATVYIRKDGETWTAVTSGAPTYATTDWVTFTQGAAVDSSGDRDDRVYISDGVTNMSYYDLEADAIVQYTGLSAPSTPTVVANGSLGGSNYTQYYRITANNEGGESAASASGNVGITTARDFWTSGGTITVSWTSVSGAVSYSVYTADQSGAEAYLATVSGVTFTDDGSLQINTNKLAPNNDSSSGPILKTMINANNQLFGCGDPDNPSYLWYSGQGQHFGDFGFNPLGGGYVGIDYGGDTIPTVPFSFEDGKGNPVLSILTHGPAGRGKLIHLTFTTTTVGTQSITQPSVYEASSKDGTPAPRGVSIYNNNAYYCTGTAFKTTGIKPNVINILSTDTISNQLLPDLQNLSLGGIAGAVAQEYLGKIYFAVPVAGSATNNEIWILDLTRGGLWILRWPVNVDHIWLYEDNSGNAHLLTLQGNIVLELDLNRTSTPTQDNGLAFSTSLGSGAMVFDKGGVAMFSSYFTYFKFLSPIGTINISVYGITEDNPTDSDLVGSSIVNANTAPFGDGYGTMMYSNPKARFPTTYSGDIGIVTQLIQSIITEDVEIDEIVNQQSWLITTTQENCDYLLSSVTTTGFTIPRLYSGQ